MDRRLLLPSAVDQMLAVNAHSRIRLGQALCEEIADRFCLNEDWEHEGRFSLQRSFRKVGFGRPTSGVLISVT